MRRDRMTRQHRRRHPKILRMRRHKLLRRPDFNSLPITPRLLRWFSQRNTVAEAVAQAVVDTAVVVAPAAAQVAGRAEELVAAQVAGQAVGLAVVKVGAPAAARAAEKAGPAARAVAPLASARTAIRLTIRRDRLFRNFPRLRLPINR